MSVIVALTGKTITQDDPNNKEEMA